MVKEGITIMSKHFTSRYKIKIDEQACGNAIECLKCVRVCRDHGPNVLGYVNKKSPDIKNLPSRLEDIDHKIIASFTLNCDGCGRCVGICPQGAISLIAPEPQIPRAMIDRDEYIVLCGTLADGSKVRPPRIKPQG
jgi:NAD-dependent dihydropyrimidine dehydrogenase PreA subunit